MVFEVDYLLDVGDGDRIDLGDTRGIFAGVDEFGDNFRANPATEMVGSPKLRVGYRKTKIMREADECLGSGVVS